MPGAVAALILAEPPGAEAQQAVTIHRISFLGLTPGEDTTSMTPVNLIADGIFLACTVVSLWQIGYRVSPKAV